MISKKRVMLSLVLIFCLLISSLSSFATQQTADVDGDAVIEGSQIEGDLADTTGNAEVGTDTVVPENTSLPLITSENQAMAEEEMADTTYVDTPDEITEDAPFAARAAAAASYSLSQAKTDGTISDISYHTSFDAAKAAMNAKFNETIGSDWITANSYVVRYNGKVVAMMNGMAAVTSTQGGTLTFNNNYGGSPSYVTNLSTMYYYGTDSLNSVKVGIAGLVNYTSINNLVLIPLTFMKGFASGSFASTNVYERDYYSKNSSGDLVHTITTFKDVSSSKYYESGEGTSSASVTIDKAPSFMQEGTRYYSMDGVNFYSDQFLDNKVGTHYVYYKYLSYHSKSNYTAANLNTYIANNYPGGVLNNNGNAFINAQTNYGINALLELAFACHESAGGTSTYAVQRNNLFGINANDNNPNEASYFNSVADCVARHADRILKQGYFDALSDSRYFGANPGNKATGVNVKYASDPYHGEKIAGWAYRIDKSLGLKDYGKSSIGISGNSIPVYSAASNSKVLYKLYNGRSGASLSGLPVVVLAESGNYYKVQSDMPIQNGAANCYAAYNYNHVGYVLKSDVTLAVSSGIPTEPETPDTDPPQTEAPQTNAPETDPPQTSAPETDPPQTNAPETNPPQTDSPSTEAPTGPDETKGSETPGTETGGNGSDGSSETVAPEDNGGSSEKPDTGNTDETRPAESNPDDTKGTDQGPGIGFETEESDETEAPQNTESTDSTDNPENTDAPENTNDGDESNPPQYVTEKAVYDSQTIKELIEENKTQDVVIKVNDGSVTFTFKKGTMILAPDVDVYDFNTELTYTYTKANNKSLFSKNNFIVYADYAHTGQLPTNDTVDITLFVGDEYSGKELHYYYVDGSLKFMQTASVSTTGYITIQQKHCSEYVILSEKLDNELTKAKTTSTSGKASKGIPKTGDNIVYIVFAIVSIMSLAVIAIIPYKKKKA